MLPNVYKKYKGDDLRTRVRHNNFEGDLTPPEVFVCTTAFVELSQSDNDFEEFVGAGAASAIWSDQFAKGCP